MPTVLRFGPYRFFFYSSDGDEPPHVHVEREGNIAKFWIDPARLAASGGFRRAEFERSSGMVSENEQSLLEAWNDFFAG